MKKKVIIILLLLLIFIITLLSTQTQALMLLSGVRIPSYKITINRNKIDNINSEYPLLNYKGITYLPLTSDYSISLGLVTAWSEQKGLSVDKLNFRRLNNENEHSKADNVSLDSKIPVLMYHHISSDPEAWNDIIISPEKFKEDMLYLKALGYNTIHFKDYFNAVENGTNLPENPIIITFDDGYRSNYVFAYPVLKELNMKATIFIIGWSVGGQYDGYDRKPFIPHFTWEEGKEMYDSGVIDIQNHSYDLHNFGDNITQGKGVSRLEEENIADYVSRFFEDTNKLTNLIEEKIGNDVIVFSYPYGIYNELSEIILEDMGFKASLSVHDGIRDFKNGHYLLERINMPNRIPSSKLMKKILELDERDITIPFLDIKNQTERIEKLENFLSE